MKETTHKCYDCERNIKGARYLVKRKGKGEYVCEECYLDDEPIEE